MGMFSSLSDKLAGAMKIFKNKGKITEADVKVGMREIKMALLEADVNFKVVKEFIAGVQERCVGEEVLESLVPSQQIVKIVNEELVKLMGGENERLQFSNHPPTVVLMAGLQGAGKTTHCAKLAKLFQSQGKRPLLIACDVYRPAAIQQLQVVGEQIGVPVFTLGDKQSPVTIAKAGIEHAKQHGHDLVLIDTAGRLHVDDTMMEELVQIKEEVQPQEILLVVDAMTGQDAVNVASSFDEKLNITGVVMTKLDGDTRGGAALSIRHVTGKPIKFIGTGEKLDMIEPFHPDRMASRILGMGDVLSLIEKAEKAFDDKQAQDLERKMRTNTFDLNDFLEQFRQVRKIGSMDQLLSMVPGVNQAQLQNINIDEKQFDRLEAIILSMTPQERAKPSILAASRKRRIAAGCGQRVEDINRLMKQFEQMQQMMKQFGKKGFGKRKMRFPGM